MTENSLKWQKLALVCHICRINDIRFTIQYDCVYLTCSKKATGSQLSLPHGINKKLKCETKSKLMSMKGPVKSHYHEGSPVGKRSLRCEGFVEKVGFEPGVKKWRSDGWWEWGWWERWVDEWMRRWIETRLMRLMKWICKLIPKTKWRISKWVICDFMRKVMSQMIGCNWPRAIPL